MTNAESHRSIFGNISSFTITGKVIKQDCENIEIEISKGNVCTAFLPQGTKKALLGRQIFIRGEIVNGMLQAARIAVSQRLGVE